MRKERPNNPDSILSIVNSVVMMMGDWKLRADVCHTVCRQRDALSHSQLRVPAALHYYHAHSVH